MAKASPDTMRGHPDAEKQLMGNLLDALDARSRTRRGRPVDQRAHPRHRLRADCLVRYFAGDGKTVEVTTGRTRNLSRSGVGFIVKRWFRTGDPVYLVVTTGEEEPAHLAGKVVCARRAHGSYFEVGVQLQVRKDDDPLAPPDGQRAAAKKTQGDPGPASDAAPAGDPGSPATARKAADQSKDARRAILHMAKSPNEAVRAKALQSLIDTGEAAAEAALICALSDEDKDVRLVAIGAVGAMGLRSATKDLKKSLQDESVEIQLRAAAILGRFGDAAGLHIAESALEQDDEHAPLAAFAYGAIIGQKFRPNNEGVAAARRYRDARQQGT